MDRQTRVERILEDMKRDNERIWEAVSESCPDELFCEFYRNRSGVELIGAVDKMFKDYWRKTAESQAEAEEMDEFIDNQERRRVAIGAGA